jgi:hypothetical protein
MIVAPWCPGPAGRPLPFGRSRHLHCGYIVTYISPQLAYFMGFTRVYLLGVDFDYSLTSPSQTVE